MASYIYVPSPPSTFPLRRKNCPRGEYTSTYDEAQSHNCTQCAGGFYADVTGKLFGGPVRISLVFAVYPAGTTGGFRKRSARRFSGIKRHLYCKLFCGPVSVVFLLLSRKDKRGFRRRKNRRFSGNKLIPPQLWCFLVMWRGKSGLGWKRDVCLPP